MATINHGSGADIIVPSSNGTTYRGLAGDDTYIISNSIAANASVTIVDTSGANTIQLVDGLSVKSSKFAADAVQLTLSNGAVVTINGASNFTFDVGGNTTTGTTGSSNTLAEFAAAMGVATLPSSGSTEGSSDISIANNGVSGSAAPTFTVTKDASKITEGDSVTFTITASSAVSADTSFSWTVIGDNNGATVDKAGNSDVDVLSGTATIASGSTSATFAVTATTDAIVEGLEGIKVSVFDSNSASISSSNILIDNGGSSATSQAFSLTTGVNEFTGGSGNDSFDASTADSLNDYDVLDGAGGYDTLTAKSSGADGGLSLIPQLSNIEHLQITSTEATGGADVLTVELAAATGLEKVSNVTSTDSVTFDNVPNTVDVNLKSAVGTTTVDFGKAGLAGTADAITVTLNGTNSTTLAFTDDDALQTVALETITIASQSVPNTLADLQTTGVATSALHVTGDKLLTITAALDAEILTVDASGSSGGLSLGAAPGFANATVTGSSGADTLTAAPVGVTNLSLGAGNDTVDFDATLTAADVVDGGDGTDTVTISGGNLTAVSVLGGLSNVEVLKLDTAHTITLESNVGPTTFDFTDATDQILNLNDGYTNATSVKISGDGTNADKIVNTAGVDLTVTGYVADFDGDTGTTITGGTGTDSLVMINAATGTASIAANITGVENITISDYTAGADPTLTIGAYTLDATFVKSLTIDASTLDAGEVFTLAGAASVTRMNITSGAAADALTLGTLADTVDGGAGNDTITGTSGGNVITAGAGNDVVTAGTGAENISGGAGDDTFTLAGNLNSADTIDGGDGTDTLTITSGITTASVMGGVSNIEVITPLAALTITANGSLGGANSFDLSDDTDQVLTLTSAAAGGTYSGDTTVMLTNLAAATDDDTNADTVTNSKGVTLNVIGYADNFDAGTTITGSATATDTLTIIADGNDAILSGTTYLDKVVIQDSVTQGTDVEVTPKATDATTPSLTIDASALDTGTGAASENFTLDGDSVTATKLTATGGDGADTLLGGQANDTLDGGAGLDAINGNEGVDHLSGGAGNDTFTVDAVSDHTGALGTDTIDGGAGTDTVAFGTAQTYTAAQLATISNTEIWTLVEDSAFTISDTVLANNPGLDIRVAGNGTVTGGEDSLGAALMTTAMSIKSSAAGNLKIVGSAGDDSFTFYATESLTADDTIDGNAGTDTIYIVNDDGTEGTGDATTAAIDSDVSGIESITITDAATDNNAGDVTITIANGYTDTALTVDATSLDLNSVTLANSEALDLTSSDTNTAITALGGEGHDIVQTNAAADSLVGGGGNDSLYGGGGADTIEGGAGVDSIKGEGGTDYIDAGAGNDIIDIADDAHFKTSGGVETIKGGAGTDTLKFSEAATVTLTAPELEHLYGVEVIQFANGGNAASLTLGNATFTNNGSTLTITGNTTDGGTNYVDASAVTNGSITVTANTDTGDNDSLYGGSGDDTFTFAGTAGLEDGDILDGNGGTDTISLNASAAAVTIALDFDDVTDMEKVVVSRGTSATDGGDVTITIEDNDALTAAQEGALSLTVDATAMNTNNLIFNNAGTDDIDMALTITGGTQVDTIKGSSGADVISGGGTTVGDSLYGMSGADSITGNSGADSIDGGAGNDVMLDGGAGADTILGGTGNDVISGGTGIDLITGGGGTDNLTGGTGNDSFNYTAVTDSQTSTPDVITDFTQSTLNATTGALVTEGDNIRLTFTMANGDDSFVLADKGDETSGLITSLMGTSKGDFAFATDINTLFIDRDGDGTLNSDDWKIQLTGLTTFHDDDIDLYVTVGTGNDTLTGGDGDDSLTGNSGNDSLTGDGGNDTIGHGGNGANTIKGGAGDDSITGGTGADSLYGGSTSSDTTGTGNDTIATGGGADTVYGGDGNDSITGGAAAESLYGQLGNDTITGAAGADSLYGGGGNDTITDAAGASSIEGGAGNDSLTGGADADTIKGGDGNDTVAGDAAADSLYGDDGDDVITSGAAADSLHGGAGNDSLTDAAGASSLSGGTGDDTLIGGAGVDTMTSGTGNDVFDLTDVSATANAAVITDFADVGTTTTDTVKILASLTSDGTAAGSNPVFGATAVVSPADNMALDITSDVDTGAIDILELATAQLANVANADAGANGEGLFKAIAAVGANNEVNGITVDTAGDKFYILAYDNSNAYLWAADSGADTTIAKTEVNLIATFDATAAIAVGAFDTTDFVLG